MAIDLTQRLKGKVAVVTAAGQGIGRAAAERLAAEGATVWATDLNGALLSGFEGETSALDATDNAAVRAFFERFETLDILVHAVGYVHQGTIEECSPEDWRRSMSITLDSAYNVIGATIPKMLANGGGSIITIGSIASSIKGFARRAAYGAAKGGVLGLTKAVAADYLKANIRCNSVCPGTVDSPSLRGRVDELAEQMGSRDAAMKVFLDRQPSGRLGTPEEIAGMCAYLASDDGRFVTGQFLHVDGGITI